MCKGKFVYAKNYTHILQRHILKHPAAQFGISEKIFFFSLISMDYQENVLSLNQWLAPLSEVKCEWCYIISHDGIAQGYRWSQRKLCLLLCEDMTSCM